jgi:hypothetical protein
MIDIHGHTTGDGEEKKRLENEVQDLNQEDLNRLWSYNVRSINSVAKRAREDQAGIPRKGETTQLRNPYEGHISARQLDETVDDFLRRLPVLNSGIVGPWLWIANFRIGKNFDDPESSSLYPEFMKKGRQFLDAYLEKKKRTEMDNPHLTTGWVTRRLGPDRDKLRESILKTATDCKETCGKASTTLH